MKKILLLLTFIIACNFAPQCHTYPIFTGKNNPAPLIIIAAALAATGVGIYGFYLFIYDKFFSVNNGNINIKLGNIHGSTIKNIGNIHGGINNSSDGLFSRIINFFTGKAQGNNWNFIEGNGTKETKTIQLHETFEGIIASSDATLNLHASITNNNILETTTDQNILEYLQSTFNNNTYTIEIKAPPNTSINSKGTIHNLYLNSTTLANLKSFKANNYLKAMLSKHITSNQFKLCAENHAEIDATFESLDELSIDSDNHAKIRATGTTINTLSINSKNHAGITATGTTINTLSINSENYDNIIVKGQIERTKATLSNHAKATVNTKNLSYDIENYASLTHNRSANITQQKCSNYAKTKTLLI